MYSRILENGLVRPGRQRGRQCAHLNIKPDPNKQKSGEGESDANAKQWQYPATTHTLNCTNAQLANR